MAVQPATAADGRLRRPQLTGKNVGQTEKYMKEFRYFLDPRHPLSSWTEELGTCHFCGLHGPGFSGGLFGPEDIERLCEDCLHSGRIGSINGSTCEGDFQALRAQLGSIKPNADPLEKEKLAQARTKELEERTPPLTTWQDFFWPAHCGDYCVFVEELGQPEVVELAGSADPDTWIRENLIDPEFPPPWDSIRRTSARKKPTESYDLTVYRFECRECGANRLHWDAS